MKENLNFNNVCLDDFIFMYFVTILKLLNQQNNYEIKNSIRIFENNLIIQIKNFNKYFLKILKYLLKIKKWEKKHNYKLVQETTPLILEKDFIKRLSNVKQELQFKLLKNSQEVTC